MNYSVESLVDTYCSESFKSVFQDVKEIVEDFELEGLEEALDNIAMSSDMYDTMEIADVIYQKVYEYLDYLLRNHEIVLNDDTDISSMVVIANGIQRMQNWVDHASIIRITETDMQPEEKFANLIALVDTVSSNKIFPVLSSVPESFIRVLEDLHRQKSRDEEAPRWPKNYISDLRGLKTYFEQVQNLPADKILAFDLVAQGMQLGGTFAFYYSQVQSKLDTEDYTYLSYQYLCLLYLGYDSYQSILGYWRSHNENLIDDLSLLSKVDAKLNAFMVDYDKWKSSLGSKLELL